jgi:hypothetical protein
MGTALACREDSIVHALLQVFGVLEVFAEEDESSTRAAEGLVSV